MIMANGWVCKKCGLGMNKVLLPTYEHQPGIVLTNVEALQCPKCHEFIFDEKQIIKVEKRVGTIKSHAFAFDRKITVSGRSLVVNLPEDIVRHMKLRKGMPAKLVPIDHKRMVLEVG